MGRPHISVHFLLLRTPAVRWFLLAVCLLGIPSGALAGSALLSAANPTQFFTNLATRLLRTELNQDLRRIQLYPTNQYSPALHRLLQVTANIYDCTTNRSEFGRPYFPSVFRPVFTNDSGTIFICDYVEENGVAITIAPVRDLTDPEQRALLQPTDMVLGVPVIIGARKGFPNFNEFAMDTSFRVQRRLEFRRGPDGRVNETNQMILASMTNRFGLEAWNSYSNVYPRELQMHASVRVRTEITNESRSLLLKDETIATTTNIAAQTWPGFINVNYERFSFKVPIDPATNVSLVLPASTYIQSDPKFVLLTNAFERAIGFPAPNWYLNLRVDLLFYMIDTQAQRIIDYVSLTERQPALDVFQIASTGNIYSAPTNRYYPNANPGSLWATNRMGASESIPTFGVLNQIMVCLGATYVSDSQLRNFMPLPGTSPKLDALQWEFRQKIISRDTSPGSAQFYAPLEPFRTVLYFTRWQANDPLVHHTLADLKTRITSDIDLDVSLYSAISDIRRINSKYEPWAPTPVGSSSPTRYDVGVKDPLITRSDDWRFPENAPPSPLWLGRVHRGTPWMTLYLKPAAGNLNNWFSWCNMDWGDAAAIAPFRDHSLVSQIAPWLNTNAPVSLASLNQADAESWTGVLNGLLVLTNTVADEEFSSNPMLKPRFGVLTVQSNSSQAGIIATELDALRRSRPNARFSGLGDILAAPSLSLASPYLNRTGNQSWRGISDSAYETLAAALLTLLRPDSVGTIASAGAPLEIHFTGLEGSQYAVESSPNLLNWTAVSTNLATSSGFRFIPSSSDPTATFYRSSLLQTP